jgi:hypothetical protein
MLCSIHVRLVPYYHSMVHPEVLYAGEGLWRVAPNTWNKQQQTASKGWSFSIWVGCGADNPSS